MIHMTDNIQLVVEDLPHHLVPKPKLTAKDKVPCFLCNKFDSTGILLSKMREHVSQHILFALHGIQEAQDNMKTEVCEHLMPTEVI